MFRVKYKLKNEYKGVVYVNMDNKKYSLNLLNDKQIELLSEKDPVFIQIYFDVVNTEKKDLKKNSDKNNTEKD